MIFKTFSDYAAGHGRLEKSVNNFIENKEKLGYKVVDSKSVVTNSDSLISAKIIVMVWMEKDPSRNENQGVALGKAAIGRYPETSEDST